MTSIERVKKLLNGELPDRPPIHDLICNDAVLEYFGGEKVTVENAKKVVFTALPKILDSTRFYNFLPQEEGIKILPSGLDIGGVLIGQDIAFKTNIMFPITFMKKEFFLFRIIDILHKRGIKVMFHSDGNLMSIMDALVECGVDLINPFEILAGMDVKKVHKLYPDLIIAGGIDVSQLLPFGTPEEIKRIVEETIDVVEGRILVGSSTELQDTVPLENFLAMYETVLKYRF